MDLLSQIRANRPGQRQPALNWPVGQGSVVRFEEPFGHQDARFSPEEYGDYIATSGDIYSVITLCARMLQGLRLNLFRGNGSDKRDMSKHAAAALLRYVNPFWTGARLARMDAICMRLWGESYWAVEKDPFGNPTEIWWVKPTQMRPVPHEKRYLKGFLYQPMTGGPPLPFAPDEVVWFRYPNPIDEFSPLSPLVAARLAADTGQEMMRNNQSLFHNGLQLGGLITPPEKVTFSEKQADELDTFLQTRWKNPVNAKRWSVLRYEAQLKSLNVTPRDAEWADGLNLTLRRVCNAYGVASPLLNDTEHATLANMREYERITWAMGLQPDSELHAADIVEQFLPMFRGLRPDHAEYDYTKVPALQDSATAAWQREAQAIDRGALKINEWRASKGMPPVPWGDVYWAPVNKRPVTDGTPEPAADTEPAEPPAEPPAEVDAQQAAGMVSALEMARLDLRHGPMRVPGLPTPNGHRKAITS